MKFFAVAAVAADAAALGKLAMVRS